jgi:hypothetical protein
VFLRSGFFFLTEPNSEGGLVAEFSISACKEMFVAPPYETLLLTFLTVPSRTECDEAGDLNSAVSRFIGGMISFKSIAARDVSVLKGVVVRPSLLLAPSILADFFKSSATTEESTLSTSKAERVLRLLNRAYSFERNLFGLSIKFPSGETLAELRTPLV